MKSGHPLSEAEFKQIYAKVPRLTVEVIIKNQKGEILLTKRAIPPCQGQWHLPGGTVRLGESLLAAVRRVSEREVGLRVDDARLKGYIEYPSHYSSGQGYPVGIAFEVTKYGGSVTIDADAEAWDWFRQLPKNLHRDQDTFLLESGYLAPGQPGAC